MLYPWINDSKHQIIQKKKEHSKNIRSKIGFRRKKIGKKHFWDRSGFG